MLAQDYHGADKGNSRCSDLAEPTLVRFGSKECKESVKVPGQKTQHIQSGLDKTGDLNKCPPYSLPLLKRRFDKAGLSKPCRILALHAWREGTRKSYRCYIIQWMMYCDFHNFDPYEPSIRNVTNFLRLLFQEGASYSTINIARCALSAVLDTNSRETIGSDPMVSLVLRGCGNLRPPEPKYDSTWDVSKVFKLFNTWGRNSKLPLLKLSKKLTMLLLLCTAQRGQTIWRFHLSGLRFTEYGARFNMKHQLKQNKPGEPLCTIKIFAYDSNSEICPISCLREYIRRTSKLRNGHDQLLLKSLRPHGPISRNTVASWTKKVLREAGIDTSRFAPHSTRAASTSAALASGININTLMAQASWKRANTFAKHYNKPIEDYKSSVTHKIIKM